MVSKNKNSSKEHNNENMSLDSLPNYEKELHEIVLNTLKQHYKQQTGENLNNETLQKLNLTVTKNGKTYPTNALLLLSDDDLRLLRFPHGKIECACFKGTERLDFISQKSVYCSLSQQSNQAYNYILKHIKKGSTHQNIFDEERWEYPMIAIQEIIHNGVIHRDYSLERVDIKIVIFADRIEIITPGSLSPTVDYDDPNTIQAAYRNTSLLPIFKKLGLIEQAGNGLKTIDNDLKNYPEIDYQWKETEYGLWFCFKKKEHKS